MRRARTIAQLLFAAAIAVALVGCGASSGEPCQEQDDCASGLMCCKTSPGLSMRGTCGASCMPITARDAGRDTGGGADAGTDAAPAPDAGSDAGVDAGATADAGVDSGGSLDAGADSGGGSDAGIDAG